jgi:hypothetical protein
MVIWTGLAGIASSDQTLVGAIKLIEKKIA